MTMQEPLPELELLSETDATLEAQKDALRAVEVPVEVNKELAQILLGGVELLNGARLTIGLRSAGEERFSMRREGGDRIFVPSSGDKQLLPVVDEAGKRVREGYLTGLLGVYLKCQRAVNLGGSLPKWEIDNDLVNSRRVSAIYALVDVIAASVGGSSCDIDGTTIEAVTAYVQTGASNEGEWGTNSIGERVAADALAGIVPALRGVIDIKSVS